METIRLPGSARETTRLGFGCSGVMGAMGRAQSLAMLEAAFDAGVRHFDVAPMYGYGAAEGVLGEFLRGRRNDVTVTTKYGIAPPKNAGVVRLARRIVGPVVGRLPGLKAKLARAADVAAAPAERARFSAVEARASLERSLGELKTERIDVWLLHEAIASDLTDEGLLRFLEEAVASGKIGTFGVGSEASRIPALLAERPEYCRVLQYEWSVMDGTVAPTGAFRIHHRALTDNFRRLHAALLEDREMGRRWSAVVGLDLAEGESLAHLMLKAALVENAGSVILFSSKSPKHLQGNVRAAEDGGLVDAARRLHRLVQTQDILAETAVGV